MPGRNLSTSVYGRHTATTLFLLASALLLLASCADDPARPAAPGDTDKAMGPRAPGSTGAGGRPTGVLRVDVGPDIANASWTLWGPGGRRHGQGDQVIADAGIGRYHIAWEGVEGWTTPAKGSGFLFRDGDLVLVGTYGRISTLPYPASPEQLMANFQAAYEAMDVEELRHVLHPDFVCLLQPATQEEFPDLGPTLDWSEEMDIATGMFSGGAIVNSRGDLIPGVAAISFPLLAPMEPWAVTPPTDPIPDVYSAAFEVMILWDRPGYSTLRTEGVIRFYAAGRDSLREGVVQPYFQMVGQLDLTGGYAGRGGRLEVDKAVEQTSWGAVKALWY